MCKSKYLGSAGYPKVVRFETFKHILPASTKPAEYDDPLTEEDDRDPVEVHLASSKRAAYAAASRRDSHAAYYRCAGHPVTPTNVRRFMIFASSNSELQSYLADPINEGLLLEINVCAHRDVRCASARLAPRRHAHATQHARLSRACPAGGPVQRARVQVHLRRRRVVTGGRDRQELDQVHQHIFKGCGPHPAHASCARSSPA